MPLPQGMVTDDQKQQTGGDTPTSSDKPGFFQSAYEATPLPSLVKGIMHPSKIVPGIDNAGGKMVDDTMGKISGVKEALHEGNYGGAAYNAITGIPLLGPALERATNQVADDNPDSDPSENSYGRNLLHTVASPGAMGTLTGTAATLALPAKKAIEESGGGPTLTKSADVLRAPGKMVRAAAIGDTDAAALRGLHVGPKSDAQLSTIKSVNEARPYVAGATSQADLQSRIRPAMDEVWNPYSSAVDAIGDRPAQGPDGPTTVRELENERLRLSALNRGVKSGNPSDIQQAIQEGRTPAQLIEREEQIKAALDPHLASTGIKPEAIRGTYGSLADVRSGVEGKTTLNEKPQPSGFGRMGNLDVTRPKSFIGEPLQGMRDIAAGRPLWSAKPTDLGIREGFAEGGPKPDLGRLTMPDINEPRTLGLNAPRIELGNGPDASGTPSGHMPSPFYADTTPMRTGRLLEAPPHELPGRVDETPPPMFRHDTTPMRMGRTLPAGVSDDFPLSSYKDIFPDQFPEGTRIRPKTIEGKK